MTDLTLVADSLLSEELVRKKDFALPGDRVKALSERIEAIQTKLKDKQKVTDPIAWKDIKNKGFAWNELPGVPYASRPTYGVVMTGDDIFSPIRDEDHYIAATCKAVSAVPVGSQGIVPITRTINGQPLSADVWISAADVGSYPREYMMDALKNLDATYQLYVPDETTINGYSLKADVWLKSFEVGVMTKEDWDREYKKRLQEIWDNGGLLGWKGARFSDRNVFADIGITDTQYNSSVRGLQVQPKGAFAYGSDALANNYDAFVVEAQIPGSPNLERDFFSYSRVAFSSVVPVTTVPWKESVAAIKTSIDRWYDVTRSDDLVDMSKFHLNGARLSSMYAPTPTGSNISLGIGSTGRFCWKVPNNDNFILQMGGMNLYSAGRYLVSVKAANLKRQGSATLSDMMVDIKIVNGNVTTAQGSCPLGANANGWSMVTDFGRNIR